jgi:hypothetical protein
MPILAFVSVLLLAFFQQAAEQPQAVPTGEGGDWQCPATPVLDGESKSWFEGTFGERHVSLYLDRGDTKAVGAFYATDDWKGISLGGHLFPGGKFALGIITDAATEPSAQSGLRGQFLGDKVLGTWMQDGTSPAVPVNLHQVPEPQCDGHGPWKLFSDRRWPIEFSYPANWHVAASEKEITVTCPDPERMAYEGWNIQISKSSRKMIPLLKCGTQWIFNADNCDKKQASAETTDASVKTRNGVTHYGGWVMEDRDYCAIGGYKGLGAGDEGEHEVVQVGNLWIEEHASQDPDVLQRINLSMKTRP